MLRLALLGICVFAPVARAADRPDLAWVGFHQAGFTVAQQDALAEQVAAAVDASGRARLLSPAQVAGTIIGRERIVAEEGLAGPGRAKLQAGLDLYNQAQPEAAIGLLEEAIVELERAFPGVTSVDDLWMAHVVLGTAHVQMEGSDRGAFAAAAALDPSKQLDAARFAPDVVAAYAESLALVSGRAIDVTIEAPSAQVFVDGVDRGLSPVTLRLTPGLHHAVAVSSGGRRAHARVVVPEPPESGEQPPMRVALDAVQPTLGQAGESRVVRSAQTAALYRSLGTRAADVELVMLAGVDGASLHLQLYHPPSDALSRPVEVPYADDPTDELLTTLPLLLNLIDPESGEPTARAPVAVPLDIGANSRLASMLLDPAPPVDIEEPRSRRRTGWIVGVVGGVAAASLAGGAVALALREPGAEPVPTEPANSGTIVIDF